MELRSELFNNREMAFLLWGVIALTLAAIKPVSRRAIRGILGAILKRQILGIAVLMACCVTVLVMVLKPVGLWTIGQLKETVLWFFGVGLVVLVKSNTDSRDSEYFWNLALDCVGVTVLIEFVSNLHPFPLIVEFVSVPLLFLAGAIIAISKRSQETAYAGKVVNSAVVTYGLGVLAYSCAIAVCDIGVVWTHETILDLLLPIILTLLFIPFAYLVVLYSLYESAFSRLDLASTDRKRVAATKWKVFARFGFDLRELSHWVSEPRDYRISEASDVERILHQDLSPWIGSAEIVGIRIEPWTNPDGRSLKMVVVDWKNTGRTVIRYINANVTLFGEQGDEIEGGARDYPIYAVSKSNPGVGPGETYIEPVDDGFLVVDDVPGLWPSPKKASVEITHINEVTPAD